MNNSLISSHRGQIQELIGGASSIGIIVGSSQNIDTMGAALGLYLSLINSGKNVQIVSKKDPIVELSNLFAIDRVSKSFSGTTKVLTISVPYRDGEIEKVSYNIEGNKLNVNLFAEENGISFNESDVEYIRKGASPSLIIAIGVVDEAEISSLADPKTVKIMTIDRSPLNSIQGDVVLVDPGFSSVSEVVALMIRELGLPGDPDAFQNLMDGVMYSTRNFTNPAASSLAFEAAGFLLSNGARRKNIQGGATQNRPDNRFPDSNQFMNRRPRPNRGGGNQQPRQGGYQHGQQSRAGQNQPQNRQSFTDQSISPDQDQGQRSNEDVRNSAPDIESNNYQVPASEIIAQTLNTRQDDVVNAMPAVDPVGENIPDDWLLPKVFKGSKKGQQN